MTRNYIGLSCSGHDGALAIVDSHGSIVFAEATERHLQNKRALGIAPDDMFRIASLVHDHAEPDADLVVCKSWSVATDSIVSQNMGELRRVIQDLERARTTVESGRARKVLEFLLQRENGYVHLLDMHSRVSSTAGRNLRYRFPHRATDIRSYAHHLTHAAAACFTSPFADATCVVVDGMGEGTTVSCYHYAQGRLQPIGEQLQQSGEAFAGLGLFYADLCSLCGFDHWRGEEWKVMGLAAYGAEDERLYKILSNCLQTVDLNFRRPAAEASALSRLWNDGLIASVDKHNRAAALARAGQRVFEELLSQLCRNARELSGSTNLVLTGGCALNSSANGKLLARTGFDRLYVPSAPADDGNAIGAALLAYFEDHPSESPKAKHQSPYLGSRMSGETLERTARVSGFRRVERLEPRALCDAVAEQLAAGALVGWVQGRAEFGPRALGNRSILADPRQAAMKDRINDAVKFREEFRPFAPAILAEHAATYFEDYQEAPYMERTLRWRPEVRGQVSAAVHVDGTGRLQTVHADWNPLFHGLLSRFYEKTGVPVLINTSFNVMGKPIVHSVEDAIAVFATSALDLLVIEEYLFAKC